MKKILMLSLLVFACCLTAKNGISQQSLTGVRGMVYDYYLGPIEPIIGATVMIKNSGYGTITAIDGTFTLLVPSSLASRGKCTVVISFIGYVTEEIEVPIINGLITDLQIGLQEDESILEEVV